MKYNKMKVKIARKFVWQCRKVIKPNDGFLKQLKLYSLELFPKRAKHKVWLKEKIAVSNDEDKNAEKNQVEMSCWKPKKLKLMDFEDEV